MREFVFINQIIERIEALLAESLRNKTTSQHATEFLETLKNVEFKETSQPHQDFFAERPHALQRVESFDSLPDYDLHIPSNEKESDQPEEKPSFELIKPEDEQKFIYVSEAYLKDATNEDKAIKIYKWIKNYIYEFYSELTRQSSIGNTESMEIFKKSIQTIYEELKLNEEKLLPCAESEPFDDQQKLFAKFEFFNFIGITSQQISKDTGLLLIAKLLSFWKSPKLLQVSSVSNSPSTEQLYKVFFKTKTTLVSWLYSPVQSFDLFKIMAYEVNAIIALKNKQTDDKKTMGYASMAILHSALYQSSQARGIMFGAGRFEEVIKDALIALKTKYDIAKIKTEMSDGVDSHRFLTLGEVSRSIFFNYITKIVQECWRDFKNDGKVNIQIYEGLNDFNEFVDGLSKADKKDEAFKRDIIDAIIKFRNVNMLFDTIYTCPQNSSAPKIYEKNKLYLEKTMFERVKITWYENDNLKNYEISTTALSNLKLEFPGVTEAPIEFKDRNLIIQLTKICNQIAVNARVSQLNNFLDGLSGELEDYYSRFEKFGMLDVSYQKQKILGQDRYFLEDKCLIKMTMIIYLVNSADHYSKSKGGLFSFPGITDQKMELANKVLNEHTAHLAILEAEKSSPEQIELAYEGLIRLVAQSCLYKISSGSYPLEDNIDTEKLKETLIAFLSQQQQKQTQSKLLMSGAS